MPPDGLIKTVNNKYLNKKLSYYFPGSHGSTMVDDIGCHGRTATTEGNNFKIKSRLPTSFPGRSYSISVYRVFYLKLIIAYEIYFSNQSNIQN